MSTKSIRARLEANWPKPATNATPTRYNSMYLRGPGSALQYNNIHDYHAQSCNACHETAKAMDAAGPEQVLRDIEYYAQQMHENAQNRKWNKFLDFVAYSVYGLEKHKELIRKAVNNHVSEVARKRGVQTPE